GARWIDSTDPHWPAYTLRTSPMTILIMNSGAVNGSQKVPSTGQPFGDHQPYPPATVDYVVYPGSPTHNTVHAYTPVSAPASSDVSLRASTKWYIEALHDTRTGLYEKRPMWAKTSAGGVFVIQLFSESGDTVPSAYPAAEHRLGFDGGRCDNTVDPYSAIVPAPDGSWTGVDLSGRVWNMDLTGNVVTLAGPKQNRAFLPFDFHDLTVSDAQLASVTTNVGGFFGFGDFGGAADLCYDPRNSR